MKSFFSELGNIFLRCLLSSGILKLSERYIARKLQRLEIKINLTKIDQNQPKFQISEVIFTINM